MFNRLGSRAASAVALGVFALAALAGDLRAQGLRVVGYGDLEWSLVQTGNPDDEWHHFFDNHHINLILVGWVIEDLVVGVEVEYEHAGEEIVLEYGYLAYTGIRNLRLAGGKFIIPFGRWNKDIHPTWISKMPGRPLVYSQVFPSTYSDVGIWGTGAAALGGGSRFVWDAYIVNGLKGDPDASSFRGLRDNDRDKPDDDNKGIGGRLGIEVAKGLGIGGSVYYGGYAEDSVTADRLNLTFLGGDIDYRWEGLELRGEFVYARQDLSDSADTNRKGFYAQAAYLPTRASGAIARFEPVVRYSWVDFEGESTSDTHELGLGASYYISASSSLRAAWFFNWEREGPEVDNNKLITQFNVAF